MPMSPRFAFIAFLSCCCLAASVRAEEGWLAYEELPPVKWQVGLRITAGDGPSIGVTAAAPVPTEWPEQSVELVEEEVSENIRRLSYRNVEDGARQMVISIPRLAPGETATALLTFEVKKRAISLAAESDSLAAPSARSRELAPYLVDSPFIESRHPKIRALAGEIAGGAEGDWKKAEAIYDWVREHVAYREGDLKGAVAALESKSGDCEELTSLFVALCRAEGIPARTVWVPRHCYPEFYLELNGRGAWIPCQAAGGRSFGRMDEARPILQKGDSFRLPEFPGERLRYARVTLKVSNQLGRTPPAVEHIERRIE